MNTTDDSSAPIGPQAASGTSSVIASLTGGTTYCVWIKAKNCAGTSGFSPSASGAPTIAVTDNPAMTLKAIAYKQGYSTSSVPSAVYTLRVGAPSLTIQAAAMPSPPG